MHSSLLFLILISFSSLTVANPPFAVYLCSLNTVNTVLTFAGDATTGLLTKAHTYRTGGCGCGTSANHTLPAQGVITVIGRFLFAVNPCSNTITQFLISALDATVLIRVGIFNTGGHFPTACGGFSNFDKNVVCAVNSGQINGVRCWNFNTLGLQLIAGADRLLDLSKATPPAVFNGLSQILFLLDGGAFCILNKSPVGSILMYAFDLLTCLPAVEAILSPAINTVNYAGVLDPRDGSLVVTDNIGVRIVSITHGLTSLLPSLLPLHLPGCGASWIHHSLLTDLFYVANRLTGTISVVSRGLLGILNLDLTIDLGLQVGFNINSVADLTSVFVWDGTSHNSFLYANCPNARTIIGLTLTVGGERPHICGNYSTGTRTYHATGMCSYVVPEIGK